MSSQSVALIALALITAGCASGGGRDVPTASAELRDASGRVVGSFMAASAGTTGVAVTIRVNGIAPGTHGIHVHAVGSCEAGGATAFASAGGHFNPTSKQHGRLNPNGWHGGDLPNIVVGASGQGSLTATAETLSLDTGSGALLDADGSAIVLHANEDDEKTDNGPSGPGNSGARIACGVIRR